jgi:hypothetical protein
MKQLGVWPQCRYPGFSSDPMHAFSGLAHDLLFAADFLSGDASVLKSAAECEAESNEEESGRLIAGWVGDKRAIEQMQALFKERQYAGVVSLFIQLKYPERLKPSELRMVEIAKKRQRG